MLTHYKNETQNKYKIQYLCYYRKKYKNNYNLIYNSSDHNKASIIAIHLLAFLFKLYSDKILTLFSLYYQELAISCT